MSIDKVFVNKKTVCKVSVYDRADFESQEAEIVHKKGDYIHSTVLGRFLFGNKRYTSNEYYLGFGLYYTYDELKEYARENYPNSVKEIDGHLYYIPKVKIHMADGKYCSQYFDTLEKAYDFAKSICNEDFIELCV